MREIRQSGSGGGAGSNFPAPTSSKERRSLFAVRKGRRTAAGERVIGGRAAMNGSVLAVKGGTTLVNHLATPMNG